MTFSGPTARSTLMNALRIAPNSTFDQTAGSHSLAAAGQRERSATWMVREP